MDLGGRDFRLRGFQAVYWIVFSAIWSFFVLSFILSFLFTGVFLDFSSDQSLPPLPFLLIPILVPIAFLFITITYFAPKLLKGGYYFLTQKPILSVSAAGINFFYPFQGLLPWEQITAMRVIKSFSNLDQLVIKTRAPTPLALKALKSNWFFLNGFLQVFNRPPKDENTIRYMISETGIKMDDLQQAISNYAGPKPGFTFEII